MYSSLIKSFKHDGSSHRMWMYLNFLKEDNQYYYLASKRAKVIEHDGREWRAPEGSLYILSKNRFFNVICMFIKPKKICYYVNIASPSIKVNTCFEFIDYDLDLKKSEDGKVREIDWGEYRSNSKFYNYSQDLKVVCEKSLKEVEDELIRGLGPFNDEENFKIYEQYLKNIEKEDFE